MKNAEATNEILSWEPISETWSKPDLKLATQRAYHAVTELDLNTYYLKWFLLNTLFKYYDVDESHHDVCIAGRALKQACLVTTKDTAKSLWHGTE